MRKLSTMRESLDWRRRTRSDRHKRMREMPVLHGDALAGKDDSRSWWTKVNEEDPLQAALLVLVMVSFVGALAAMGTYFAYEIGDPPWRSDCREMKERLSVEKQKIEFGEMRNDSVLCEGNCVQGRNLSWSRDVDWLRQHDGFEFEFEWKFDNEASDNRVTSKLILRSEETFLLAFTFLRNVKIEVKSVKVKAKSCTTADDCSEKDICNKDKRCETPAESIIQRGALFLQCNEENGFDIITYSGPVTDPDELKRFDFSLLQLAKAASEVAGHSIRVHLKVSEWSSTRPKVSAQIRTTMNVSEPASWNNETRSFDSQIDWWPYLVAANCTKTLAKHRSLGRIQFVRGHDSLGPRVSYVKANYLPADDSTEKR